MFFVCLFFFFKQKTAYEMRISDWSSDVCSSDLRPTPQASDSNSGRYMPSRAMRWRSVSLVMVEPSGLQLICSVRVQQSRDTPGLVDRPSTLRGTDGEWPMPPLFLPASRAPSP